MILFGVVSVASCVLKPMAHLKFSCESRWSKKLLQGNLCKVLEVTHLQVEQRKLQVKKWRFMGATVL